MPLFPKAALNDGVRKREVFGWAMYDFANSGYTTVVLTAVFNAYFVGVVARNESWATLLWTLTLAASSAIVMLTMPALGGWADRHQAKKRLLALTTAGCVVTTALLVRAQPDALLLTVVCVIASNVFYSYGESLTAAFLPELASRDAIGKVSGWGWSFGYFGGMLTLGASLAYVLQAQGRGEPATAFVPVTMAITAGIYGIASLPTFLLLKERSRYRAARSRDDRPAGLRGLLQAWTDTRSLHDFRWLMWCTVAYQAGIAVVIALAAVYAEQVFGFTQSDTMLLVFLVNIASAIGAFAWGYVQDRLGHTQALGYTLWGWVAMTVLAVVAGAPALFWGAAVLAGLCMGSSQSAGRSLIGLLTPEGREAEFFGLWTFSTRLAAIVGPITYGVVTWLTGGNHRLAILSTGAFFLLGVWLLRRVDLERGAKAARAFTG